MGVPLKEEVSRNRFRGLGLDLHERNFKCGKQLYQRGNDTDFTRFRASGLYLGPPSLPQHEHSPIHKWVISFRGKQTLQGNSRVIMLGMPWGIWSTLIIIWLLSKDNLILTFICLSEQRLGWRIYEELPTHCKLVLCIKTCEVPPDLQGRKRCCPEGPWDGEVSNQMTHQPLWSSVGYSVPF